MNSKLFVGTMRLAIIAGLLIVIAGGNSNAQTVAEYGLLSGTVELARGETLRVDLTNRMVLKRQEDDPPRGRFPIREFFILPATRSLLQTFNNQPRRRWLGLSTDYAD